MIFKKGLSWTCYDSATCLDILLSCTHWKCGSVLLGGVAESTAPLTLLRPCAVCRATFHGDGMPPGVPWVLTQSLEDLSRVAGSPTTSLLARSYEITYESVPRKIGICELEGNRAGTGEPEAFSEGLSEDREPRPDKGAGGSSLETDWMGSSVAVSSMPGSSDSKCRDICLGSKELASITTQYHPGGGLVTVWAEKQATPAPLGSPGPQTQDQQVRK